MPLKNSCSIHARWSKSSLKRSIRFCGICPSLKHHFIAYRSSKMSSRPDCIFEIHPLWKSGFRRVYSNSFCSCSFEPEIIEIGQSSHKMYSNNVLNFQESMTILNACTKVWKLTEGTTYIYIYIYCERERERGWKKMEKSEKEKGKKNRFRGEKKKVIGLNIYSVGEGGENVWREERKKSEWDYVCISIFKHEFMLRKASNFVLKLWHQILNQISFPLITS